MADTFNPVGWFEIPVNDMDRAVAFYEKVFQFQLQRQVMEGLEMAWFPFDHEAPGTSGSLIKFQESYTPSQEGTLVYFTSQSGDLANELGKVEEAGGNVLIEKRLISPEVGYMGVFLDSEGNRIALHSKS